MAPNEASSPPSHPLKRELSVWNRITREIRGVPSHEVGGPVSSLVLLTECHGAQAEAQIPDPLGGSVANKTVAAGAVTDIAS